MHTKAKKKKRHLVAIGHSLIPSGLFQVFSNASGFEGTSQAGLSLSILHPFPCLCSQCNPSCLQLPGLPALGCHGAVQMPNTSFFP